MHVTFAAIARMQRIVAAAGLQTGVTVELMVGITTVEACR